LTPFSAKKSSRLLATSNQEKTPDPFSGSDHRHQIAEVLDELLGPRRRGDRERMPRCVVGVARLIAVGIPHGLRIAEGIAGEIFR